jgi:hypothetical protein
LSICIYRYSRIQQGFLFKHPRFRRWLWVLVPTPRYRRWLQVKQVNWRSARQAGVIRHETLADEPLVTLVAGCRSRCLPLPDRVRRQVDGAKPKHRFAALHDERCTSWGRPTCEEILRDSFSVRRIEASASRLKSEIATHIWGDNADINRTFYRRLPGMPSMG